ncbi:APC family permease [soil metagenome]
MSTPVRDRGAEHDSDDGGKGLRPGVLGLLSSVVIAVSSTAPGYGIAATIGPLVAISGIHSPGVMVIAFLPMLFIAYAYREMNRVAPDCGTTFTWATRAFGPRTGWMGGWGIVAADIIVMASLAQIAGSYFFQFIGADGLANDAVWVTVAGCIWIVLLTYICYRGIEVSARFQFAMLGVEAVVLLVFAVVALIKVYTGHAPAGAVHPALNWFNPFHGGFSGFSAALLLAVFIYWGWDSAASTTEETKDRTKTPGTAVVISTVILLVIFGAVSTAVIAFGGASSFVDSSGVGVSDAFAVIGNQVFGTSLGKVLVFCILTSAAASTQTTILPTARTTLSMAAYQAFPASFARIHPRYRTPTVSTLAMGGISILFYIGLAAVSSNILADSASAVGLLIAFYYGLTGFASFWWFLRRAPGRTVAEVTTRLVLPLAGGLILLFAFIKTVSSDYQVANSATKINLAGVRFGGIFAIAVGSLVIGVILMLASELRSPAFFRGSTLNADTEIMLVGPAPSPGALELPDSEERTVQPPLTEAELREAQERARRAERKPD